MISGDDFHPKPIENKTTITASGRIEKEFLKILEGERCFQKAVEILYERLDLLSSEELIFYYRFIVSKARRLYVEFVRRKGGKREDEVWVGEGGGGIVTKEIVAGRGKRGGG